MARDYELGLIINPDVGDEQARAIVDRVTQTITANDGQVVRVNAWGRRRFAYPIEHHRDGLYFFFDLILAPETVTELERTLRVNEDVLRHLVKLRDSRVVAQQRQREAEAEVQAQTQAAERAAQAEQAEAAAREAAAAEAMSAPEATPAAEAPEAAQASESAPEAAAEAAEAPAEAGESSTATTAEAEV